MIDATLSQESITALIRVSKVSDFKVGTKTTVVCLTLPSGFEIIESSSCVKPENYDHELGKKICIQRITNKVWELEGYRVQCALNLNAK